MQVTTDISCGNGRVLRATPELIEVELIAYSKGSRYTYFQISGVAEPRRQAIVLRPDRHFRNKHFAYKLHSHVWVKQGRLGEWTPVDSIEKTPEAVRFFVDLRPEEDCFVSTEPPREYARTTQELFAIAHGSPQSASIHCLGHSIEGRLIFLLRVSDPQNRCQPGHEKKPVIHIVCGEHATEFSGEEMGRGMLNLVRSAQSGSLRKDYIFDFVLNANPDGNFHGWHQYNAKDWLEHNYADVIDRSWHHEFVPYLMDEPRDYSPETGALMNWLQLTRPAFYLSLHSWEGHAGNPGAFYTDPRVLSPSLATAIRAVNEIATASAAEMGQEFHANPAINQPDVQHLGHYLMENDICLAYLPEGHFNPGRKGLQAFGETLLGRWLADRRLNLQNYDRSRWLTPSKSSGKPTTASFYQHELV